MAWLFCKFLCLLNLHTKICPVPKSRCVFFPHSAQWNHYYCVYINPRVVHCVCVSSTIVRNSCLIGVRSWAQVGVPVPYSFTFRTALTPLLFLMCALALRGQLWNMFLGDQWLLACRQNLNPGIWLLFDGVLSGAANHPQSPLCFTPPLVLPLLHVPHPSISEIFTKRIDWLPTSLYQFLHLSSIRDDNELQIWKGVLCYSCPD